MQGRGAVAAVLVLIATVSLPVAAHAPSTFMIILKSDGPVPGNATNNLWINDSVWFRNVDTTQNQTHTVVVDMNGDGLFNGSEDITSAPLSVTCEKDDEGNKTDPTCEVVLVVTFNRTNGYLDGWYAFEDRRSDGNSTPGILYVRPDNHTMSTNTTTVSNTNETTESTTQQTELQAKPAGGEEGTGLLLLSAATGFTAIGIIIVMLREIQESETTPDSEEEEQ